MCSIGQAVAVLQVSYLLIKGKGSGLLCRAEQDTVRQEFTMCKAPQPPDNDLPELTQHTTPTLWTPTTKLSGKWAPPVPGQYFRHLQEACLEALHSPS